MGSYEQWKADDDQWVNDNLQLIRDVFLWFARHREWPGVDTLRHRLLQTGDRITDVQAIADAKPKIPGLADMLHRSSIVLGARHLLQIREARTLLVATSIASQRAVHQFLRVVEPGEPALVKRGEVEVELQRIVRQRLSDDMVASLGLVPPFVTSDNPTPFAGGNLSEDWTLNVHPDLVVTFDGAENPLEYVGRQLQIIQGWCEDYDARTGIIQPANSIRWAFIVMPFEEPWSNEVHAFINRAVDEFRGRLVAVRADQIDVPGKITEQIVSELANCDLIIADISGNNPNVAWELGFSHAHGKPCVILRQSGLTERAPFDIYDHRRVEYSAKPTADEEERLIRVIGAALERVDRRTG